MTRDLTILKVVGWENGPHPIRWTACASRKASRQLTDHLLLVDHSGLSLPRKSGSCQIIHTYVKHLLDAMTYYRKHSYINISKAGRLILIKLHTASLGSRKGCIMFLCRSDLNSGCHGNIYILMGKALIFEPPHGKTNNLHMRKQRRRSASR